MNTTINPIRTPLNLTSNFTPDNALAILVILTMFVCVGATGNAMVVYFTSRREMKLSNILVMILAMSDGLYCISSYCFYFPDLLKVYQGQKAHPSYDALCRFGIAIPVYFAGVNVYCMTELAITRYVAIVKPRYLKNLERKGVIFTWITLNWSLPLIIALPQGLDGWGGIAYHADTGFCSIMYNYKQGVVVSSHYIFLILSIIFIPSAIVAWSYYQIYLEVHRSHLRVTNIVVKTENKITLNSVERYNLPRQNNNAVISQQRRNREIALAKTLFVIVMTYQISYFPYGVLSIFNFIAQPPVAAFGYQFTSLIATYIGNVANPIIFLIRNQEFRQFFLKKKKKEPKSIPKTSESVPDRLHATV